MSAAARLASVRQRLDRAARANGRDPDEVTLIAVSKTFDAEAIRPVIAAGQRVFGENRVQEAKAKWPALRAETPDLELHLIGPLQTNKAREAVALFDAIQSVDRDKLAAEIAKEEDKQKKRLTHLVQVNTGAEAQKAGVDPREAVAFAARCRDAHRLDVVGFMCIPPIDDNPGPHFALLSKLAREAGLPHLSMGMSSDFEEAVRQGATYVRVGSAIFGSRQALAPATGETRHEKQL